MTYGPKGKAANLIVARFRDGRVMKGRTFNLTPDSRTFYLNSADDAARQQMVFLQDLKAVFFVNSFEGDPSREKVIPEKVNPKPGERLIIIRFDDGEIVVGSTLSFSYDRLGFFITPLDPTGNAWRVFVVKDAVAELRLLKSPLDLPQAIRELRAPKSEG